VKVKYTFLVLILINISALSQDNIHYFAEEGTVWNVGSFSSACNIPTSMIFLQMEGDTLIDNLNYHIIWRLPCEIQEQFDTVLAYFIRIDSEKKMFLRTLNGVEKLIFDYNLELNETFNGYAYFYGDNFIAVEAEVREVYYDEFCGVTRKVWGLDGPYGYGTNEYWIEGIGSKSSLLDANMPLTDICGGYQYILCAYDGNVQIYDNPNHNACEIYQSSYFDRFELFASSRLEFNVVEYRDSNIYSSDNLVVYGNTGQSCSDNAYYHIAGINKEDLFNIFPSEYILYKVWADSLLYVLPKDNDSHLAFDYKAELGDTLEVGAYNYYLDTFVSVSAEISEIDSLTTDDGVRRKYWELSNENGSTRYVEGLGNDEGLLAINWCLTGVDTTRNSISCAWRVWVSGEGHTLLYDNPDFDSCLYYVPSVDLSIEEAEIIKKNNPRIYPNPFINCFTISSEHEFYTAHIYNAYGAEVLRVESDEPDCQICLTGFKYGIYYIRIETLTETIQKTILKL